MISKKWKFVEYNILAGLLYQGVTVIVGFALPRLLLVYYGSDVNGELTTIKQIFAYLALLEAGVGLATTQALYQPVALDEHNKINRILSATGYYYRRTGFLYAAIVATIGFIYPLLVDFTLSRWIVFAYTLLYGLPSVVNFCVQGKYGLLMQADGHKYVLSNLDTIIQLLTGLGKIAVLIVTKDLLVMQTLYCLCSMIRCPVILWYIHKNYPWIDVHAEPDFEAVSAKGAVLLHQLSAVVFNNTDMVLLSFYCDFRVVSVYSVYNMFFAQVSNLLSQISGSIVYKLGQLFQTDQRHFWKVFDIYETVFLALSAFCYTMMAIFLLPIIRIYTSGVNDINYIDSGLVIMFALKALLDSGKVPYHQIVEVEGAFRETRWHAIAEMLINLIVTAIGIPLWGIYGSLIGTIAALIFRWFVVIHYAYRKLPHKRLYTTYFKWLYNLATATIPMFVLGVSSQPQLNLWGIVGKACSHAVWIVALYVAVNYLTGRKEIRALNQH